MILLLQAFRDLEELHAKPYALLTADMVPWCWGYSLSSDYKWPSNSNQSLVALVILYFTLWAADKPACDQNRLNCMKTPLLHLGASSICLSIYLSIYLSVYLSIYLSKQYLRHIYQANSKKRKEKKKSKIISSN